MFRWLVARTGNTSTTDRIPRRFLIACSRRTRGKMSDDEYDDASENGLDRDFYNNDEDENASDMDDETEPERAPSSKSRKVSLSRDRANVGKSLRGIDVGNEDGEVVKKARIFDNNGQLSMGQRERANLDDLAIDDDELQEEEEDHSAEEKEEVDNQFKVMRTSTRVNGEHVRRQRKTEAEILGIRIRLQGVLNQLVKVEDATDERPDSTPLRDIVDSLLEMRSNVFDHGLEEFSHLKGAIPPKQTSSMDEIWAHIQESEESLWEHHETVIRAWERRAHLSLSRGKELRAMNKSAFEQVDAALARRMEIGKLTDFVQEDQDFYQSLLRDFVQARAMELPSKQSSKRAKYLEKQKNRGPVVRYEVREKMVNFLPPVPLAAPPLDVDQLIKSLFRT
jgi:hypothetical protein